MTRTSVVKLGHLFSAVCQAHFHTRHSCVTSYSFIPKDFTKYLQCKAAYVTMSSSTTTGESNLHSSEGKCNTDKNLTSLDNATPLKFTSRPNPVTGKMDWVVQEEDYDYIQEIARSGYGDMLHDTDRNEKYYMAIKQAVKLLRSRGKPVKVLDIGTGTGLLSMMAATAGADTVTACEAFPPMAECAGKVLETNGFKEKIRLISKRSTDIVPETDMPEKANLLVTELFDTELIGEGAIPSYTDAHARLMEEDCVAVPTLGIMYVQAVEGSLLRRWNGLQTVDLPNDTISIPQSLSQCRTDAPLLHDLQVDQLREHLTFMSEPVEVFRFDFSRRDALKKKDCTIQTTPALQDGCIDAFVMWWDLQMDPQGEITLSCAPSWVRQKAENIPWRDHWMQALYYPSSLHSVKKGEKFNILGKRDEYSLAFDVDTKERSQSANLHMAFGRGRLGQVNDPERNHMFVEVLQKQIKKSTTCLVISDGSLLPLMAAKLGAAKVFYKDTSFSSLKVVKQLIEHNDLAGRICVLDKEAEEITEDDLEGRKIDLIIAEPFSQAAHLPWEHLYFWYATASLQRHLAPSVTILPQRMEVKAMAVQLKDLHKIRAPVGVCEGFDISHFDRLIEVASDSADENIEPQPLWEYPAKALSAPVTVASLDFRQSVGDSQIEEEIGISCCRNGLLNGIAFWTEYDFGGGLSLSNGLLVGESKEELIRWDKFSKQGVHLFRYGKEVKEDTTVKISSSFKPQTGDFAFFCEN